MRGIVSVGLVISATLLGGCAADATRNRPLVTEEFMIPGPDPGVELYVRNKRPADLATFSSRNVVLFVHGATFPSETSFDLRLDGLSWMDYIARHGYDVYLMDVRGYGMSSRPPEMDQPAKGNAPIVRTEMAARDFGAAVDFVLQRRGIPKLTVLAWSWGTTIAAVYTTQNNDKVDRLVLYAPQWIRNAEDVRRRGDAPLGAYRIVKPAGALKGLRRGTPAGKSAISNVWANEWARATFASDLVGAKAEPPFLRAPNGAILDGRLYWSAGKALYDPANVRVPTLVVRGEWDVPSPEYMAKALYEKLVNAKPRHYVTIPEGTHSVLIGTNRMRLFTEVQRFLEESMTQQ